MLLKAFSSAFGYNTQYTCINGVIHDDISPGFDLQDARRSYTMLLFHFSVDEALMLPLLATDT